jgi:hypothetical protein
MEAQHGLCLLIRLCDGTPFNKERLAAASSDTTARIWWPARLYPRLVSMCESLLGFNGVYWGHTYGGLLELDDDMFMSRRFARDLSETAQERSLEIQHPPP